MTYCLVVDDSSIIRKVARRILEGLSFEVTEASDGKAAFAACKARMPDAILLDHSMPETDTFALLKQLRAMPNGETPRVVYCATENDVSQIARAMHAGANDYVLKPFDKHILTRKIADIGLV